jgi:hypothetical protein
VADECRHPASQRSTTIKETWFEIITTVTCSCGATVSENRVRKIQPTDPGTR